MGNFKRSSEKRERERGAFCTTDKALQLRLRREMVAMPRNLDEMPRSNVALGQKMAPAAVAAAAPPPPLIDDGATTATVDDGRVDGTSKRGREWGTRMEGAVARKERDERRMR